MHCFKCCSEVKPQVCLGCGTADIPSRSLPCLVWEGTTMIAHVLDNHPYTDTPNMTSWKGRLQNRCTPTPWMVTEKACNYQSSSRLSKGKRSSITMHSDHPAQIVYFWIHTFRYVMVFYLHSTGLPAKLLCDIALGSVKLTPDEFMKCVLPLSAKENCKRQFEQFQFGKMKQSWDCRTGWQAGAAVTCRIWGLGRFSCHVWKWYGKTLVFFVFFLSNRKLNLKKTVLELSSVCGDTGGMKTGLLDTPAMSLLPCH